MKIDPLHLKVALMVCLLGLVPASTVQAATSRCSIPTSGQKALPSRKIGTEDLLELRDFGNLGTGNTPAPFAVSPDGHRLAVELRQANADTDSYCTAIVIIPVKVGLAPVVIDDAGDIVPATFSRYGMVGLPLGTPKLSLLRWSASVLSSAEN